MRLTLAVLITSLAFAAQAADKEKFGTLPEPPPPPENYKAPTPPAPPPIETQTPEPEPEVTITTVGKERHEEYRIGGRLYMIKVIPQKGPPYYLVDNEGHGNFSRSDLRPSVSPPMWVLKRF